MTNKITINQILERCEIPKASIIIIEQLNFFLKTDEDRAKFTDEYDNQSLWLDKKASLKMVQLAKQIGSHHYTYDDVNQLNEIEEKDALERLFVEPFNLGKLLRYKEFGSNLHKLITIKKDNPRFNFMQSLMLI